MDYRTALNEAKGKRDFLQAKEIRLRRELEVANHRMAEVLEPSQALIQKVAQETQTKIQFHIENIVQLMLDAVFPEQHYVFHLDFEAKRGRTEARVYLTKGGDELDPVDSNGGGLVDIVALALRISCFSLSHNRPVLLLDEPMKWVSRNLQEQAAQILKEISHKLGLQLIVSTHIDEIVNVADRVFKVTLNDDLRSEITLVR